MNETKVVPVDAALDALNRMQSIMMMDDGQHPRNVLRDFINAAAPNAAGQEMTGEGPKGDTVAPVPAAPDNGKLVIMSVTDAQAGTRIPAAPDRQSIASDPKPQTGPYVQPTIFGSIPADAGTVFCGAVTSGLVKIRTADLPHKMPDAIIGGHDAPEPAPSNLRYIGASDAQVNYRGNDDPRGFLTIGNIYAVLREDVYDCHTDIYLVDFPNLRFNSVCFDKVTEPSKESTLPLSAEQIESFRLHHISLACHTNYKETNLANKAKINVICDQALAAIELERENAELKRTAIKLTPVELQSGLDRVRFAELLIKQLPGTHDGRNTWLLNYSHDMADELKQRLKLTEHLRGRVRIEGEDVGAPHLREDEMSDTPRTDKLLELHNQEFISSGYARGNQNKQWEEFIAHARQLEREIAELKRRLG